MDSIICISKIRSKKGQTQGNNNSQDLFEEAFDYAKTLGDEKYAMNCLCNLGIMEGGRDFEQFSSNFMMGDDEGYDQSMGQEAMLKQSQSNVVIRPGHATSQMSQSKSP